MLQQLGRATFYYINLIMNVFFNLMFITVEYLIYILSGKLFHNLYGDIVISVNVTFFNGKFPSMSEKLM